MRNKHLIFIILSSFILLFATACSDDNDEYIPSFPGGTEAKLLPVKIYDGDNKILEEFTYDELNRLTEYNKFRIDTEILDKTAGKSKTDGLSILYNEIGDISEVLIDRGTYTERKVLTYNGSEIRIEDNSYLNVIETQDRNLVVNRILSVAAIKEILQVNRYTYDQYKNIKSETFKGGDGRNYKYDDKNGIFSQVNTPQWFLINYLFKDSNLKNNRIQESPFYINAKGDTIRDRQIFKYNYEYNNNGYPYRYNKQYIEDKEPYPELTYTIEYREAN